MQFEVSSVNFGKVLTGTKNREVVALSNHENTPFAFNFDQSSWILPDGSNPKALTFEPMSGTVPANGILPIHVTFAPDAEKAVNYNVVANVKRKPTRLTLNVKGDGYGIHEVMEMEHPVPVITRAHFEEAMANARRSVTEYDLNKFEQFRTKFDPAYAAKMGNKTRAVINWPEDNSSQFQNKEDDDDDLYA